MIGKGRIICYTGSVEAITNYLYDPLTGRIIERKDDDGFTRAIVDGANFNDIYLKHGTKKEVDAEEFDALFNLCVAEDRIAETKKTLSERLFKKL